jgi:diguanylate cyclase (GGDEF)-like protein
MKGQYYLGLFLLVAAGTLLLLGYQFWMSHSQTLEKAVTNSANLSRVLEVHLDTMLRRADAGLLQIARKVRSDQLFKVTKPSARADWTAYLEGFKEDFPEVSNFFVFDAEGQLLATSDPAITPFNIAERFHFQRLSADPKADLVFSDVIISKIDTRPTIAVARGMNDKDGHFNGIVSALVDLDHLQSIFGSLQVGEQGLIALRRSDDNKLVLRYPLRANEFNKPVISALTKRIEMGEKSGTARFFSPVDNVVRVVFFRVLTDYPFYVIVGGAEADIFAHWRRDTLWTILATVMLLALVGLGLRKLWQAELHLRIAIQKLDRVAHIDILTNLPNRRNFMTRTEQELLRTLRYGGGLSMLMMDVDNFKTINDRYGHKIGDIVLKELADVCRKALREVDIIGRIGGEEFAFALPNTGLTQGIELAERLRIMVEKTVVKTEQGKSIQFTVSIGATTLTDDISDVDILLNQADIALYEAKHNGRNRVCIYKAAL